MVGHMFHIHPLIQTATIKVEDPNFPGMDRFAKRFLWTEEWYEYDASRSDKLHYLLSVDEKTYKPEVNWGKKEGKGMGKFHPLAWYQEYDGGRAFYTGLGHLSASYGEASFMHHIYGGIYWAATATGSLHSSRHLNWARTHLSAGITTSDFFPAVLFRLAQQNQYDGGPHENPLLKPSCPAHGFRPAGRRWRSCRQMDRRIRFAHRRPEVRL
jgi:hypothetical protein